MSNMNQLAQLISIHFKEFFRQPGIIFWAILFPILMAWGLGIAFTNKGALTQKVAIVTDDDLQVEQPAGWNRFIQPIDNIDTNHFETTIGNDELGYTHYRFLRVEWPQAIRLLKKGTTSIILKIEKDSLQFHFDPLNPDAQLVYLHILSAIDGQNLSSTDNIVPLEQEGTRYIDFLVPGLLCMSVMMSCMWGISYGMIDKRSKKLLRRMVATPMSKRLFLTAQFIARLGLSGLEAVLLIAFCYFYFDVTMSGSTLAFILIFVAGNIAFTGIAIFASSRTSDTRIGNGLVNLVVMPMMVLSGIFFSYQNFPDYAIRIIEKLPLTMMADHTRSVFIEGAGIHQVLMPSTVLTILGLIFFALGLRIYKWY